MIDDVWHAYKSENFAHTLRLATNHLVEHGGIDLIHLAALSMMQMRRYDDGMILLKAATTFRPNAAYIYSNAAYVVEQLGMADELAYFTERGLRDFPDDRTLQCQHANISLLRLDYPAAFKAYHALLANDPTDIRPHLNLANTHRLLEQFDKAEEHFIQAAAIDPDHATLRISRASLYGDLGRIEDAIAQLEGVPDWDAKFMLAMFSLSIGDYARGWDLHRDRWYSTLCRRNTIPPRPVDRLEDIAGKPVAVLREGGFGDVFQFMRYLPALAEHASEVLFHPMPSELRLLRANLPKNVILQVASEKKSLNFGMSIPDSYQYTIPLLDLPYLYKTRLDNIPGQIPYLHLHPTTIDQYRLPPTENKRVGLVWAGGSRTGLNERQYDTHRSIKLTKLRCLSEIAGIEFINLQVDKQANDPGLRTTRVLSASGGDWLETAAIVAQMDLIISVDTAVVHLAAALGRPTWLLSRFNPCWRWLRNQPTSPWYPGVLRVFGQTVYGDWSETITQVRDELQAWVDKST